MAQDYVVLNEKNENGLIAINKTVFKSIAEISIDDIENAIRVPQARFTKPLTVKVDDNQLHITADIKVKYGANENIVFMTGFKPADVTVNVIDFEI